MKREHEDQEVSPLIPSTTVLPKAINDDSDEDTNGYVSAEVLSKPKFKIYKRRWYILTMYTLIVFISNLVWNTWGPISEPCQIAFGWKNWQVLFLTSWAAICMILSAGPSTWMMDKKGLRVSVIVCAFLVTLGKAFQVIPSSSPLTRTILFNIGQCIAMLNSPVAVGAPPSISAAWFPPEERTTATAFSTLVPYFGIAGAFIIGPYMVPTTTLKSNGTNASITNHTVYNIEMISNDITKYMAVQLGISAFLLICVLVYFPDKPPLPPCASSSTKQHGYVEGVKKLIFDGSYLYLGALFALSYGVYGSWIANLSLAIKTFGIDEFLSGWLGCAAVIAGIFAGLCIARCVDYVKRQTKTVLILLFFGTSISQLLFTLTCSKIIPFSKPLVLSSIVFGCLFCSPTTPLLFEMAVETVYPVTEALTAIFLLIMANFVCLIINIFFMFPLMKVEWMNWATVIFNGICVPGLFIYKNKFKRLDLD